jgi:DNA-binding NarL/FixJ family response regulator
VKSHVQRLFGKLGIKNRTQAVIYAYETGVVGQSTSLTSPLA